MNYRAPMRCIITAGPTFEPLDEVRRLTNFSSGRLGTEFALYLESRGHDVILLLGQQATYHGGTTPSRVETFSTTANLRDRLRSLSETHVDAVYHAAAVSDFGFGKIWHRDPSGEMTEAKSGKISTRQGTLLAELVPTPKIIAGLREWYPNSLLVGWKYEVEGGRESVLKMAGRQLADCRTDACVVNGPAYGKAFGLVTKDSTLTPLADVAALYAALESMLRQH